MQQAVEKEELIQIINTLDPSQLRLVLSFIKNLFDL
jgi:hypothetical protein